MLYYVQMVHNRNDYIPKQLNMSKFIPSTAIFFFFSLLIGKQERNSLKAPKKSRRHNDSLWVVYKASKYRILLDNKRVHW